MDKDTKEEIPQYTEQQHQAMIAQFYKTDKPSHTFQDQEARLQRYENPHIEIVEEKNKEQKIQRTMYAKVFDEYFKDKQYHEPSISDNKWIMEDFKNRIKISIKQVKKETRKMLRAEMKNIKNQLEMVA